jgi:hypothetical protein
MKEDLGDFLEYAGPMLLESLMEGGPFFFFGGRNDQLDRVSKEFAGVAKFVSKHGVAITIETPQQAGSIIIRDHRNLFNLEGAQLTVVFPEGGLPKNKANLVSFFQALAGVGELEVVEKKLGQRNLHQVEAGFLRATWWEEGSHLILTLGTLPVDRALAVIEGRRPNLTTLPLHKETIAFDRYETNLRGHVDLAKIVNILKTPPDTGSRLATLKAALKRQVVLNQIGLTGLKNLSFHCGYEGQYRRRTVIVGVPEVKERPGLLRLVSGPAVFETKTLPSMPPDAASVRVCHVDWNKTGEVFFELSRLKDLASTFEEVPFRGRLLQELAGLNFDFRQELIPHLDSTLVAYNAWSEGPLLLGQVVAIKVKDEAKLLAGLDNLNQALLRTLNLPGEKETPEQKGPSTKEEIKEKQDSCAFVSLLQQPPARNGFQKKSYRGADLHVWNANNRFFAGPFNLPVTYTIHKGWLVVSLFPQPVKGYIMRTEDKYQQWKIPQITAQALDQAKKGAGPDSRLVAVHVGNARPTVEVILALMPTIIHFTQVFNRRQDGEPFDVSRIPNAQAVTDWLLPNVNVMYDDGSALRWESHTSLNIPLEELFYLSLFVGILL